MLLGAGVLGYEIYGTEQYSITDTKLMEQGNYTAYLPPAHSTPSEEIPVTHLFNTGKFLILPSARWFR